MSAARGPRCSGAPNPGIRVGDRTDHREIPFVVRHEHPEWRLVRDGGRGYDRVHEIASAPEFDRRKDEGLTEPLAHTRAGARRQIDAVISMWNRIGAVVSIRPTRCTAK